MSLLPQRELTVERIYDEVHQVIQSGENVRFDNNFRVSVIWVDSTQTSGGGKRRKDAGRVFNMPDYASNAKSVVRVTDADKKCLARCLVNFQWREKRESEDGMRGYERVRKKNSSR